MNLRNLWNYVAVFRELKRLVKLGDSATEKEVKKSITYILRKLK